MNNPSLIPITSLLKTDNIQLVIPIYQRKYSWAESKDSSNNQSTSSNNESKRNNQVDRVELLFKYITDIASGSINAPTYFIGFFVTQTKSLASALKLNKFHVIDGQQRLTTISLLILALAKVCDEEVELLERIIQLGESEKLEDLKNLRDSLKNKSLEIRNKYIYNEGVEKESDLQLRLRFIPSRHNYKSYKAICENKLLEADEKVMTDPATTAYNKLTSLCRKYFKPEKNSNINITDIRNFLLALDNLKVVQLELEPEDDAKQIFETLNNAGMKLSEVDLIRNEIFGSEKNSNNTENTDKLEELYEEKWEPIENKFREGFNEIDEEGSQKRADDQLFNFIRCILQMDGDYVQKNKVFVNFKKRYSLNIESKKAFLEKIGKFHELYLLLSKPDYDSNSRKFRPTLVAAVKNLGEVDFSTCYPLILKFFDIGQDENQISEAVKILENYYVRRQLNSVSVRKLPETMIKLCDEFTKNRVINQKCSDWLLEIFKLDQQKSGKSRCYDYPTNLEIETNLKSLNVYNQCFEITHHVYRRINQKHLRPGDNKEISNRTDQQLDHIMPQNLTEEWIDYLKTNSPDLSTDSIKVKHTDTNGLIGNLTLTSRNQNMRDKLYQLKIPEFKQSPFYYTVHLDEWYPNWTFDSISKRTEEITKLALETFPDI
jgi:uncharacterized protein with ParB-like and HNH nuclease domain